MGSISWEQIYIESSGNQPRFLSLPIYPNVPELKSIYQEISNFEENDGQNNNQNNDGTQTQNNLNKNLVSESIVFDNWTFVKKQFNVTRSFNVTENGIIGKEGVENRRFLRFHKEAYRKCQEIGLYVTFDLSELFYSSFERCKA